MLSKITNELSLDREAIESVRMDRCYSSTRLFITMKSGEQHVLNERDAPYGGSLYDIERKLVE
jgi:hypothetical protein